MKKALIMLLAIAMIIGMTACSSEENKGAKEVATTEKTEEVAQDAEVEEEDSSITIGLANINERGVYGKLIKQGFEQACAERGWALEYVDNNGDGQTAVSNAEALALKDVDFVVDMNVDQSVGQTIVDIFNEAEIPVLAADIALPNSPFFGIDSPSVGYMNGEFASAYIKENLEGEVDYVVLITQLASGDEVQERVRAAVDAMDDAGIKYKEVVEIEGKNDTAEIQARISDFLTAHPDDDKIMIFTVNDTAAQGAYASAVTAGREWDVRIFSVNCGTIFVEPIYETQGNQSWVSTVDNFSHLYGEQCCELIEQYFEEGSIPDYNPCKLEVITWDNIQELYPLDNLPWEGLQ